MVQLTIILRGMVFGWACRSSSRLETAGDEKTLTIAKP